MSNAVSVLRARPIIKLTSTVGIEPILIPLNSTGLQCQQKDFKPCVTVSLCFSFSGENVPDSISKYVYLLVYVSLTVGKMYITPLVSIC